MAGKELVVRITGDASSLNRALNQSADSTKRFSSGMQKAGRAAGVAGLAIGGALVVGLTRATKGALEDEVAQGRLEQAFKRSGESLDKYSGQLEKAGKAAVAMGFNDEEAAQAVGSLEIATKDGNKAFDLLGTAMDIARFKGVSLETATKTLTMAMAGSQRAIKQLGLQIQPTSAHMDELKAKYKELGKEIPAAEKAQAQFLDKQQTSQEVIGLVSTKLAGQAKAYAETSQGGIDVMNSKLDQLSDNLGKALLPALEKVTGALSKLFGFLAGHESITTGLVIGFAALAAVLLTFSFVVGPLLTIIPALGAALAVIASPIGLVVVGIIALAAALAAAVLWPDKLKAALMRMGLSAKDADTIIKTLQQTFKAIKAVVETVWPAIQQIVTGALKVIQGVANVVMGLLQGDFDRVWKGIKQIFAGSIQYITGLMLSLPRILGGLALKAAEAILRGIGNGLKQLPGVVRDAFASLPGVLASIASAAAGWAVQIGTAITRGILNGMGNLFSAVKDKIIGGVKGAIDGAMGVFGHSPQEVIGVALVDGIVRGWNSAQGRLKGDIVDKVNETIDAAQQAITSKQGAFASAFDSLVSTALSAFDRLTSQFETKTEKLIRQQDEARARADRQRELDEARAGLATAQAGGDPAEIARAQQAVNDALFAIQRAADEKKAAQERQQYEASRERQRVNFERQLENLQNLLERGRISAQEFRRRVLELFEKFDVPFRNAGQALGAALAAGLHDSFAEAAKTARELMETIAREMRRVRFVVTVAVQEGGGAERRQHGGPVKRGEPYIVGEAGPELFIPSMSGQIATAAVGGVGFGNATAEITVPVYIDSTKVTEVVRREMLRFEKRNGRAAI